MSIRQYEDESSELPIEFEANEKQVNFPYRHQHSKVCDLDGEPTIIFKSSRANFERRQRQRRHVISRGLKNYFFIIGAPSETERAYVDKVHGLILR